VPERLGRDGDSDEVLKKIAQELVTAVRQSITIDWDKKGKRYLTGAYASDSSAATRWALSASVPDLRGRWRCQVDRAVTQTSPE
jgi:hypothetical protein